MKKLSFQKIFCFISFLFILSCCIFYGTRFIKLYLKNNKEEEELQKSLIKVIHDKNENNDNFKYISGDTYFINNSENNYLKYSNILWRIIKVNNDNSITLISNNSLTSLAYGENVNFDESYINKWLNYTEGKEYSGIFEKVLNKKEQYLTKTQTCLDKINEINNNKCQNSENSNYISLLNIIDFVNIGNKNSYIINNENFYLSNINDDNKIWYIKSDNTISNSKGLDIIGVKPVITIKPNVDYVDGDGTINNPYIIEKENGLFGSYVKLGNELWQIYKINDDKIYLALNDYLKVNNEYLEYIYSNTSSYHNDTKYGSIAYYLNNTFYNSLSYKDKIKEVKWTNGYYGSSNNYNYEESISKENTIDSKIALMSIGDIFLNNKLENYYTMTGVTNKGTMVYTIDKTFKAHNKHISQKTKIVPTISIDKNLLTKGNGTLESPFEME